VTVVFVGLNK